NEVFRCLEIALSSSEVSSSKKCMCSCLSTLRGCGYTQRGVQPHAPFAEITSHQPKSTQRSPHSQRLLSFAMFPQITQRCAQIAKFTLQNIQLRRFLGTEKR